MDVTGKGQRTCTNIHRMWDRRWFNGDINVKSVWRPFHAAGSTVGLDIKGSARPEACWFSSCLPCAASALWAETAGIIGPSAELLWAQLGAAWVPRGGGRGQQLRPTFIHHGDRRGATGEHESVNGPLLSFASAQTNCDTLLWLPLQREGHYWPPLCSNDQ